MSISTRPANMQLLFPTVVQAAEIENPDEVNGKLLDALEKIRSIEQSSKPQAWACNLYTTIGNPKLVLEHQAFQPLLQIFEQQISYYAKAHGFVTDARPHITECWINAYGPGDAQEIHLHKNSVLSGIYYVTAPPGSGVTLFYSPWADVMLTPEVAEGNNLNASATGFEPIPGRVLLFRSSVRHSVLPGNFHGERVTISFNAMV